MKSLLDHPHSVPLRTPSLSPLADKLDGLLLLRGKASFLGAFSHRILAHRLMERGRKTETGFIVCADNAFYPMILVREARDRGALPHRILSRVFIARAFTVHQFCSIIADGLLEKVSASETSLVLLSGILPLFSDRAVPDREAVRLLSGALKHVRTISRTRTLPFLIPVEADGTQDGRSRLLLSTLHAWADRTVEISQAAPGPPPAKKRTPGSLFGKREA